MTTKYGAVIIGAGQAGGPLAQALAGQGYKTALIESTHVGGTCINEGCTPTKTMIASAKAAHVVSRANDYGVYLSASSSRRSSGPQSNMPLFGVNMREVSRRRQEIVDSFRQSSEGRLKDTDNLDLICGAAKFVGPKDIEITPSPSRSGEPQENPRHITGDKIFINVGCHPTVPEFQGSKRATIHTSTTIMDIDDVPKHLVVLGGGYVGCEFAQMFRRYGSRVSIVQRASRLLPIEDEDISEEMHKILTQAGIDIYLDAKIKFLSMVPSGQSILSIELPNKQTKSLLNSHILAATGRTPNTTDLGLEHTGVKLDAKGFIKTNEYLQTDSPEIFALGDVKGGPQFTHVSYDDFRILKHNLSTSTDKHSIRTREPLIPYTVFTDPQLGRIGLTETQARKLYPDKEILVATMPFEYIARAIETAETQGVMKAVVDGATKQILGFACLGAEGGEIASMIQIAMMGGLGYDRLENAVFSHPGWAESLNNLWSYLK